jgi:hypothetical protein
MKTFKRLMAFVLALLTVFSAIPFGATPARAAPTNDQMLDNFVLDAMEYLGWTRKSTMAEVYGNSGKYTLGIPYDHAGTLDGVSGYSLKKDANSKTGYVPHVEYINYGPKLQSRSSLTKNHRLCGAFLFLLSILIFRYGQMYCIGVYYDNLTICIHKYYCTEYI